LRWGAWNWTFIQSQAFAARRNDARQGAGVGGENSARSSLRNHISPCLLRLFSVKKWLPERVPDSSRHFRAKTVAAKLTVRPRIPEYESDVESLDENVRLGLRHWRLTHGLERQNT
jgi:hypothetical protein